MHKITSLKVATAVFLSWTLCAQAAPSTLYWPINAQTVEAVQRADGQIRRKDGSLIRISSKAFDAINRANFAVRKPEHSKIRLILVDRPEFNAYTWVSKNGPYIAVSMGALISLDEDLEAWANLLGHEYAHIELDHIEKSTKRDGMIEFLTTYGKTALGALIPMSEAFVALGADVTSKSYSRNDEREADLYGMKLANEKGFSPCGMYRVNLAASRSRSQSSISYFSTHPGDEERKTVANKTAIKFGYPLCNRD